MHPHVAVHCDPGFHSVPKWGAPCAAFFGTMKAHGAMQLYGMTPVKSWRDFYPLHVVHYNRAHTGACSAPVEYATYTKCAPLAVWSIKSSVQCTSLVLLYGTQVHSALKLLYTMERHSKHRIHCVTQAESWQDMSKGQIVYQTKIKQGYCWHLVYIVGTNHL